MLQALSTYDILLSPCGVNLKQECQGTQGELVLSADSAEDLKGLISIIYYHVPMTDKNHNIIT